MEDDFPQGALTFEVGQATALGQILGGVDADIAVRVRGEDLGRTFPMAELVRDRLAELEEIGNVRVGTERGQPEIQVEILREVAARYGIEPRAIAEALEDAMRGDRATEFVDFDRKIGIVVRLPDDASVCPGDAGRSQGPGRAPSGAGERGRGRGPCRDPAGGSGPGGGGLCRRGVRGPGRGHRRGPGGPRGRSPRTGRSGWRWGGRTKKCAGPSGIWPSPSAWPSSWST